MKLGLYRSGRAPVDFVIEALTLSLAGNIHTRLGFFFLSKHVLFYTIRSGGAWRNWCNLGSRTTFRWAAFVSLRRLHDIKYPDTPTLITPRRDPPQKHHLYCSCSYCCCYTALSVYAYRGVCHPHSIWRGLLLLFCFGSFVVVHVWFWRSWRTMKVDRVLLFVLSHTWHTLNYNVCW